MVYISSEASSTQFGIINWQLTCKEEQLALSSLNIAGSTIVFGNREDGSNPMKFLRRVDIYSQRYSNDTLCPYELYRGKIS